jgi:sec-independent protein translocase protein TatA
LDESGPDNKENNMGSLSIWHLLIVGVIILVLFGGKGKLSDIMGDFAKGIKSFKKGLSEEDQSKPADPKPVEQKPESKE